MANIYYKPEEPRRIFTKPITTSQYVNAVGRCNHCPGWRNYCQACRQELNPYKTVEAVEEYERGVQAKLAAGR
ncbi:hypothetical protein [Hymenobacter sp. YC55]|uniref:hypothetical protein n=1 Tax=Hymenobacter sp. YC55 TaxID=3034019 RepID=UPI0023F76359|nr:hypothetical protein [Hymenobacter sp. YC55]MDF7815275.1 hypothetical protein [Hymenobacter sp. YC55]